MGQSRAAKRELELKYESVPRAAAAGRDDPGLLWKPSQPSCRRAGRKAALSTLSKYKPTLARFQEFCVQQEIYFIREINSSTLLPDARIGRVLTAVTLPCATTKAGSVTFSATAKMQAWSMRTSSEAFSDQEAEMYLPTARIL